MSRGSALTGLRPAVTRTLVGRLGGCSRIHDSAARQLSDDNKEDVSIHKNAKEAEHEVENLASNANFFAVGAKAVVGTAARKIAETVGMAKPVSQSENQEPAGGMEARTGDPREQYDRTAGLAEKRWQDVKSPGMKVEDLYENATAAAQATTRSPSQDKEAEAVGSTRPGDKG